MPVVVQANAQKRLDFVLPKMKKHQDLLVWIVLKALRGGAYIVYLPAKSKWVSIVDGDEYELEEILSSRNVKHRLNRDNVIDAYIPWLANRLNKYTGRETDDLVKELVEGFHDIAIWASKTKTDLNKLSLEEALAQSKEYVASEQRKGKQDSDANPVVYRFADGHKVVQLKTDEALAREGEVMRHCVGDYCEAVKAGDSVIYSLRDQSGKSLVTMEYKPSLREFTQILGVNNAEPAEAEQGLVREFIKAVFPHDLMSIIDMGGTDDDIPADLDLSKINPSSKSRMAIAKHTPPRLLAMLADDLPKEVSGNPSTPAETLRKLYEQSQEHAARIAGNPSTPPDLLKDIASKLTTKDLAVWGALADNPRTPGSILTTIFGFSKETGHGDRRWMYMVARNPNMPADLQLKLVTMPVDVNYDTRYAYDALAGNPSLTEEAAKALLSDRLDATPSHKKKLRMILTENPGTPDAALQQIADEGSTVSFVAEHVLNKRRSERSLTNREKVAAALMIIADYLESSVPWYHTTTPENANKILKEGLKTGKPPTFSIGSLYYMKRMYGVHPVFLAKSPNHYDAADEMVVIEVDVTGLRLVADIPTLMSHHGAFLEEDHIWFEEDETRVPLDLVDAGELAFDDLLGGWATEQAIATTGTAAVLTDIPANRMRVFSGPVRNRNTKT